MSSEIIDQNKKHERATSHNRVVVLSEALSILTTASRKSGYEMLAARRKGSGYEETLICEGGDDAIKVVLFCDEIMVKIMRRYVPSRDKISTYKTLLATVPASITALPKRSEDHWSYVRVTGDDLVGLTWILRMHSAKRIMRHEMMIEPTLGELAWTKTKFEAINKKGKCDLLKYLAVKTGCELKTCYGDSSREKIIIKGRHREAMINYTQGNDTIKV